MLRWLLPLVAALAFIGQSVTTYAAAGTVGDATCCCPEPSECKCHDHDGKPQPSTLKRCSGGALLVAPAPLIAVAPALEIVSEQRTVLAVEHVVIALADGHPIELEKPPF